jgi:hypothetical protein
MKKRRTVPAMNVPVWSPLRAKNQTKKAKAIRKRIVHTIA